jgi:hypothetical protein
MPTKIHKPSPTAENEALIVRYMTTLSDDAESSVSKLAAMMFVPQQNCDPVALVAQAIEIREAAAIGLPAHRDALLRGADWASLMALYNRMCEGKTEAQRNTDPKIKLIVGAMEDRNKEQTDEWLKNPEREIEKAAAKAVLESVETASGPRPALPCQLEAAIRWGSSSPPSLPWPVLEGAFLDFLKNLAARKAYEIQLIQAPSTAEAWVDRNQQALKNSDLAGHSREHHTAELAKWQKALDEEQAIAAYANFFTPGMLSPTAIEESGAKTYKQKFKGTQVEDSDLGVFAGPFRDFWQKHARSYRALHDEKERGIKALREKRKNANKHSATQRERNRWIKFTQNFVERAGKNEITAALINRYPKQAEVTEWKGREFLKTLLAAKGNPNLQCSLSETLERLRGDYEPMPTWKGEASNPENKTASPRPRSDDGVFLSQSVAMECYQILTHRTIVQP